MSSRVPVRHTASRNDRHSFLRVPNRAPLFLEELALTHPVKGIDHCRPALRLGERCPQARHRPLERPQGLAPLEGTCSFVSAKPTPSGTTSVASTVPAKLPLSYPIVPLFEANKPDHSLTARTADRAVRYELRRFLAGIWLHWETLVRQAL